MGSTFLPVHADDDDDDDDDDDVDDDDDDCDYVFFLLLLHRTGRPMRSVKTTNCNE